MAAMPSYKRKAVLERAVVEMKERFEELALALCAEAGKPIKDARGEVGRLIDTFTIVFTCTKLCLPIRNSLKVLQPCSRVQGFHRSSDVFRLEPFPWCRLLTFP
mmetsp:Transcript_40634/g.161127  ORF Transcript_40634/g.161127 Transcript_40634/m.161127 type:complete len:104 (+) Transcript_40634:277-588(+)